jgi:hypothetical protein
LRITPAHRGAICDYDLDVGLPLMKMQRHFAEINEDKGLTEADKKQLEDFYLQTLIAPKARRALEQHIAEEEAGKQRRSRPHQDRH